MKTRPLFQFLNPLFATVILLALLFGAVGSGHSESEPPATVQIVPVTTITVNSGTDPDTDNSTTCATSPCTLRRAVIQARNLAAKFKPVRIAFNIPESAGEGWNSTLDIWKIQFSGVSTDGGSVRTLNGSIIIDGSTQPGGRSVGPKIILVGSGTGQADGLKVGVTATQNSNEIRGLGFQNFKTHIYVNSASNIIQNNWFGLSDDGTGIVLRGGGASDGSGNTGIAASANVSFNDIQYNVFTGLAGVAANLLGNDTTFSNNYIGTRADGTVTAKQTNPALICSPVDWLGGSGLSLSGKRNLVEHNIFAGLRIAVLPPTIQADTIRMGGDYHVIRDNKIGVDAASAEIGVCGRGILLQGGTTFSQITSNTFVYPGLSAISLNDTTGVSTTDANTLRGNVIKKSTPWGEIEGNPSPEDAIQVTKSMSAAFRAFKPAKVTSINGVNVSGTSGTGSPCPNCIIEIFMDDVDTINETLSSLAVVTANASGNWTAVLPAPLTSSQGLRTTSTTAEWGTISGKYQDTTTGLSELYLPVVRVFLPYVRK